VCDGACESAGDDGALVLARSLRLVFEAAASAGRYVDAPLTSGDEEEDGRRAAEAAAAEGAAAAGIREGEWRGDGWEGA
jgi:hypothetical protein